MNRYKQIVFVKTVVVALVLAGSISEICLAQLDGDYGSGESVMAIAGNMLGRGPVPLENGPSVQMRPPSL